MADFVVMGEMKSAIETQFETPVVRFSFALEFHRHRYFAHHPQWKNEKDYDYALPKCRLFDYISVMK
jgi:hypothetical protein